METMLTGLLDYQKFSGNQRLAEVISGVHASLSEARCLEDSEVDIWAAGDALADLPPTELRHD